MNFKCWLESSIVSPGETPIPPNYIRLYHYTKYNTPEAAESLRINGINIDKAQGHLYGEPKVVWASASKPNDLKVYAEFAVSIDDPRIIIGKISNISPEEFMVRGFDCAFNDSIKPNEIIAVHEPWHSKYLYIINNPKVKEQVIKGEYDHLMSNPNYGPAIQKVKNEI